MRLGRMQIAMAAMSAVLAGVSVYAVMQAREIDGLSKRVVVAEASRTEDARRMQDMITCATLADAFFEKSTDIYDVDWALVWSHRLVSQTWSEGVEEARAGKGCHYRADGKELRRRIVSYQSRLGPLPLEGALGTEVASR